ncbi:T7SS effector LXG polymorphic toxin [Streptococcus loxodontisalivarius]|uniref:LXG domain-containing protein n=1 Tax=Streptococcus loxodontisalivarius TaxID=1349415 RepID=A0ABS2PTB5_9STRE|nr:T7SS effector LXG polymorphic toxin [Streptococcus loxodontisalivarius]MBM7643131.1 hypothetical protein [Streptococcus loxodontisalivarius]
MGFHVDMAELLKAQSTLSSEAKTRISELDAAKSATNTLIETGALYGQVGTAVYNQLNNYDAALHVGMADVLTVLSSELGSAIASFQEDTGESNESAVLDEAYLTDLSKKLTSYKETKANLESNITAI